MFKQTFRTLLLILSLYAIPALAVEEVQVVSATFGVFEVGKDSELGFQPSVVVPHRQKQRYGWVIELKTKKKRVSVREEYLLPPKPLSAAEQASGAIPMERRSQVSQRGLAVIDGKIYGEWAVGPNEPAGHRHLQVFVEGELAGDFEFDVR